MTKILLRFSGFQRPLSSHLQHSSISATSTFSSSLELILGFSEVSDTIRDLERFSLSRCMTRIFDGKITEDMEIQSPSSPTVAGKSLSPGPQKQAACLNCRKSKTRCLRDAGDQKCKKCDQIGAECVVPDYRVGRKKGIKKLVISIYPKNIADLFK